MSEIPLKKKHLTNYSNAIRTWCFIVCHKCQDFFNGVLFEKIRSGIICSASWDMTGAVVGGTGGSTAAAGVIGICSASWDMSGHSALCDLSRHDNPHSGFCLMPLTTHSRQHRFCNLVNRINIYCQFSSCQCVRTNHDWLSLDNGLISSSESVNYYVWGFWNWLRATCLHLYNYGTTIGNLK